MPLRMAYKYRVNFLISSRCSGGSGASVGVTANMLLHAEKRLNTTIGANASQPQHSTT